MELQRDAFPNGEHALSLTQVTFLLAKVSSLKLSLTWCRAAMHIQGGVEITASDLNPRIEEAQLELCKHLSVREASHIGPIRTPLAGATGTFTIAPGTCGLPCNRL